MARIYTTGPAHIYTGVPGQSTRVFYLGTAKKKPLIQIKRAFRPAYNDLAGQEFSADDTYQGQEGLITAVMNRFNYNVLRMIQSAGASAGSAGNLVEGVDQAGAVGSLQISEGLTFAVWVLFPYSIRASMGVGTPGGLPFGYRFAACYLLGPDDLEPGTEDMPVHVILRAKRVYVARTGQFLLYDHDMTGLPAID